MLERPRVTELESIGCVECGREVDEFTAIGEKWGYWSDGAGELVPFCPASAKREFSPDAPASGRDDLSRRREAT
jgi:hypothetical protein